MKSQSCSHWKIIHLLLTVFSCTKFEEHNFIKHVHAEGNVGIIELQSPFADILASSGNHAGKGLHKEHFELLRTHDRARHARLLSDVVQFALGGNANPYVAGIYFTKIKLGTPPKEYFVQVDTGSDLLWLNCNPCTACPQTNNLGMSLQPYNPKDSLTSSPIQCSDPVCDRAVKIANTNCNKNQYCGYSFQYGDGSSTTGYLITDTLTYATVQTNNSLANVEAQVMFGCGYSQSGNLLTAQNVVDGIMGFGQNKLSVVSQLYSQGKTPGAFAHCLQGSDRGGGILVLGNVMQHGMVFTPMISSQPHYNVNLRGISVNGVPLKVESSAYETSDAQGTIFDSGTTLAYLMEPAYSSFVDAIAEGAPKDARQISQLGTTCFVFSGSVDDAFPVVTLHFEDADMKLKARHYLIQQEANMNVHMWCVGWHPITGASAVGGSSIVLTILGDIVLKDQLVVYDLENQRIGWVDYDCASKIVVTGTTGKSQSVNTFDIRNLAPSLPSATTHSHLLFLLIVTQILLYR